MENRLSHLGEERSCDKLFVLQEGDALAAIQLLGQVCHVRLQLCKAWKDKKNQRPKRAQIMGLFLNHSSVSGSSQDAVGSVRMWLILVEKTLDETQKFII